MDSDSENLRLCYLDAARVAGPAGELAGVRIETEADEPLGSLDGVLIDPGERRVRYFVIKSGGWFRSRRYVISADCPAKVERDGNTLRVDVASSDIVDLDEFECPIRPFSEEDAVEAMFARRVA